MCIKIAIDAGHGLKTPGKRCLKSLDPNQTREWFLNNRIADTLEIFLRSYDCEVLRTDDSDGKKDVSLISRVKKANSWGADIFISIHHNAGANGKSAGGTVIYYYSSKAERALQAKKLYDNIVNLTKLVGNRCEKTIKHGYYVIKHTKMPAFLIENGFMDSSTDVPIILSQDHAYKTATGILNFLVDHFNLAKNNAVNTSFKVKITVNRLNYRSGAGVNYPVRGVVTKNQIFTIVETSGSWGKLKSGAGWINISDKYVTRL